MSLSRSFPDRIRSYVVGRGPTVERHPVPTHRDAIRGIALGGPPTHTGHIRRGLTAVAEQDPQAYGEGVLAPRVSSVSSETTMSSTTHRVR
jgi:hypothetical protein